MKVLKQTIGSSPRLAIVLVLAFTVYLGFFWFPDFVRACRSWQDGILSWPMNSVTSNAIGFLVSTTVVVCLFAAPAIWLLSIFLAWAAFTLSHKKGYLFLLACFLLPMITKPTVALTNQVLRRHELRQDASPPSPKIHGAIADNSQATDSHVATTIRQDIRLPVGPLLLLLGLWFLYREETKLKASVEEEVESCADPDAVRVRHNRMAGQETTTATALERLILTLVFVLFGFLGGFFFFRVALLHKIDIQWGLSGVRMADVMIGFILGVASWPLVRLVSSFSSRAQQQKHALGIVTLTWVLCTGALLAWHQHKHVAGTHLASEAVQRTDEADKEQEGAVKQLRLPGTTPVEPAVSNSNRPSGNH